MLPATLAGALSQTGLLATDLGQLLVVLVGIGAAVLVSRFVLHLAWRLVTVGVVVVGVALLLTAAGVL
ncbi:hypothetical protein ACNS7O_03905 [Haloferacaceae archaeon DSL9]